VREQGKGISAFPANPLRARFICRALETRCVEVKPPTTASFNTYEYLNTFTSTHKSKRKRFDLPRNPFFNWRSGKALPNKSTRMLFDNLFDGNYLGSKWGERCIDTREQTFLCALDLVSGEIRPNQERVLSEAEEILKSVASGFKDSIPEIPNLSNMKYTRYTGTKIESSLPSGRTRYADVESKFPVAYNEITDRIEPYNVISNLCAGLMYLVKPNNLSKHDNEIALAILLEFISGVLAAYVHMLNINPIELQRGGPVVNLYRLVYSAFLSPMETKIEAIEQIVSEVFHNDFGGFYKGKEKEILSEVIRLQSLLEGFTQGAGLDRAPFMGIAESINPDAPGKVRDWWERQYFMP